jgi:hypothetical protein
MLIGYTWADKTRLKLIQYSVNKARKVSIYVGRYLGSYCYSALLNGMCLLREVL